MNVRKPHVYKPQPRHFNEMTVANVIDHAAYSVDLPKINYEHATWGHIEIKFGYDFIIFGIEKFQAENFKSFFKTEDNDTLLQRTDLHWLYLKYPSQIVVSCKKILLLLERAQQSDLLKEKNGHIKNVLEIINLYRTILQVEHNLESPDLIDQINIALELRKGELSPFCKIWDPTLAYLRLGQAYVRQYKTEKQEILRLEAEAALKKATIKKATINKAYSLEIALNLCELLPVNPLKETKTEEKIIQLLINSFKNLTVKNIISELQKLRKWVDAQNNIHALSPLLTIFINEEKYKLVTKPARIPCKFGEAFPWDLVDLELKRLKASTAKQIGDGKLAYDTYEKIPNKSRIAEDWLNLGELFIALNNSTGQIMASLGNKEEIKKLTDAFPYLIHAYLKCNDTDADVKIRVQSLLKLLVANYYSCKKSQSDDLRPGLLDLYSSCDQKRLCYENFNKFLLAFESNEDKQKRAAALLLFNDAKKVLTKEQKLNFFHVGLDKEEISHFSIVTYRIECCGIKSLNEILAESIPNIRSIIQTFPRLKTFFAEQGFDLKDEMISQPFKKQKVA